MDRFHTAFHPRKLFAVLCTVAVCVFTNPCRVSAQEQPITADQMRLIREVENKRIEVIEKVVGSVIAVYGPTRQGGGSGVIIDPSGIALTNHHVIQGAGMRGFGGLDDGVLYEWDLIGTDPGGDVAIIKMKGKDQFPWSPLGDSDKVNIGDWALAMGNPFLLAHDQVPTVTLGIVSGVERFQEGMGAELVYGNCIQIDSSINPGNSGGPLFNMDCEVIGINGRGSFRDRGRVNVGLGYAISSNQIKNFLPDLLATKIVEHGTLDAAFSNREGKVVCSTIDLDSPAARAGLELGDELLEFEGQKISYANQFKNLICTLPEDWPASLKVRKEDGTELTICVRLFGLPYNYQPDEEEEVPEEQPPEDEGLPNDEGEEDPNQEGEEQQEGNEGEEKEPEQPSPAESGENDLKQYLLNEPGVVVDYERNAESVDFLLETWRKHSVEQPVSGLVLKVSDDLFRGKQAIGSQTIHVSSNGRFHIRREIDGEGVSQWIFDGQDFWSVATDGVATKMDLVDAKIKPEITQGLALAAPMHDQPFSPFGKIILDGGDKSQSKIASRLMWLDSDDDWFYAWLSLYDEEGHQQVRLLKISSDRDSKGTTPGMTFADYRESGGVMLPWEKSLVRGLSEEVVWTASTTSVEPMPEDFDMSIFDARKDASQ